MCLCLCAYTSAHILCVVIMYLGHVSMCHIPMRPSPFTIPLFQAPCVHVYVPCLMCQCPSYHVPLPYAFDMCLTHMQFPISPMPSCRYPFASAHWPVSMYHWPFAGGFCQPHLYMCHVLLCIYHCLFMPCAFGVCFGHVSTSHIPMCPRTFTTPHLTVPMCPSAFTM